MDFKAIVFCLYGAGKLIQNRIR